MQQFVLIIHFIVAVFLIVVVLVQRGKGATMGSAFGSGASTTVFGSKGAGGFLMKLTIGLGAVFFMTSITLTYLAAKESKVSSSQTILTNVEQLSQMIQANQKTTTNATTAAAPASQPVKIDTKTAADLHKGKTVV